MNYLANLLFLFCSGRTEANDLGIIQGHANVPLNETGLKQARALAASGFPIADYELIYSSDLARAYQTARELVLKHSKDESSIRTDARLRERSLGVLDGQPGHLFREQFTAAGLSGDEYTPTDGESLDDMRARVLDFLHHRLLLEVTPHKTANVLLVSHGVSIRELVKYFQSLGHPSFGVHPDYAQIPPNTAVSHFKVHLDVSGEKPQIESIAVLRLHSIDHLDDQLKGLSQVANHLKHVL